MSNERIEAFWRDATAADVARVMKGETVEARFHDQKNNCWFYSNLSGWRDGPFPWGDEAVCFWNYCQVYDPPQYWLNKPEPGEGYRLLGKLPDEDLQPGDAFFENNQWWPVFLESPCPQVRDFWYRRRIEQPLLPGHQWLSPGDRLACGDSYYHEGAVQEVGQVYWGNRIYIENAFMRRIDPPKPEPKHYKLNAWDTADLPSGHRIIVTEHGIEVQ